MRHHKADERGFALATAILALVVVGALVTAGFFAASQESRIGTTNSQADLAFYVAEQGIQNVLGTVTKAELRRTLANTDYAHEGTIDIGARELGTYSATVRPFGNNLYWVESLGTVTRGGRYAGAQRRVGLVARTINFDVPLNGALTTYGGITLRGNAQVSGIDTSPTDWGLDDCDPTVATEAGIYTRPESEVVLDGGPTIVGNPGIERDENLHPEDFEEFGDIDFDRLAAMATWRLASGTANPIPTLNANGACETTNPENWGEPYGPETHPCYNYFPIVYHEGNLEIRSNGRGQGILLVNGDLSIGGRFEYFGLVIVMGTFNNAGSGTAEIHGSLLTKNNADIADNSEYRGTPTLQFSTCAVNRSILNNAALARLIPVQQRSWVDLTAAGVTD